jgi:hypothetical protein
MCKHLTCRYSPIVEVVHNTIRVKPQIVTHAGGTVVGTGQKIQIIPLTACSRYTPDVLT